jgi:hypothetical protein
VETLSKNDLEEALTSNNSPYLTIFTMNWDTFGKHYHDPMFSIRMLCGANDIVPALALPGSWQKRPRFSFAALLASFTRIQASL